MLFEENELFNPNIDTAPKVGRDNRNDIFAESNLLKFKILAAVMVIPDLLTPGIKDKIWKVPINIADLKLKLLSIFLLKSRLSLKYSSIPNIKVVHAITFMFLKFSIKLVSTKKKPINITGIEEIMIFTKRILFFTKSKISL